jgi:hypothetical protein
MRFRKKRQLLLRRISAALAPVTTPPRRLAGAY